MATYSSHRRTQPHSADLERVRNAKLLIGAAALISFALSISLWFAGDREMGLFVGIWVPSILSAGTLLLSGGQHD